MAIPEELIFPPNEPSTCPRCRFPLIWAETKPYKTPDFNLPATKYLICPNCKTIQATKAVKQ